MDGNTPIDSFQAQFSQREASKLSGVDMATINNWLQRGDYKLAEPNDRRLKGRRFFSIADIAALHVMDYCARHLDMRPAAAGVAAKLVFNAFGDGSLLGDKDEKTARFFDYWHIMHKVPGGMDAFATDGWSIQRVWQDRKTGVFYEYDPVAYPEEKPAGLAHFPHVIIPTSQMGRRIFLKCADFLAVDEQAGDPPPDGDEIARDLGLDQP